jgi:HSP20 family protein
VLTGDFPCLGWSNVGKHLLRDGRVVIELCENYGACVRRSAEEYIMLVRWDPFEEMNRLHDHFFSGRGLARQAFQVAVDIREEGDAFYVDADVPGLSVEDIKVDIEKNILTLSGERKVEKEETKNNYRRVERQYGSFTRSFSLPETVDTENISADLKDGVLELRLPKKEAPSPKKISVNVGK